MAEERTLNLGLTIPEPGTTSSEQASEIINENFRRIDSRIGGNVLFSRLTADSDLFCRTYNISQVNRLTFSSVKDPNLSPRRSVFFQNNDLFVTDGVGNRIKLIERGLPVSGFLTTVNVFIAVDNSASAPAVPTATGFNETTRELQGLTSGWSQNYPNTTAEQRVFKSSASFRNNTLSDFSTPFVVTSSQQGNFNTPIAVSGFRIDRGILYVTFSNLETGEIVDGGEQAFNISGGIGFSETDELRLPSTAFGNGPPGIAENNLPINSFYIDRNDYSMYVYSDLGTEDNPLPRWQRLFEEVSRPEVDLSTLVGEISTDQIADGAITLPKLASDVTDLFITSDERSKLQGVQPGAEQNVRSDWNESDQNSDAFILNKPVIEQNVQADWNETDSSSASFIQNKPIIQGGGASSFDQLSGQIFPRQIADGGIMEVKLDNDTRSKLNRFSATDKTKLDGIEAGATGDQSASEIKIAYESNPNTNAFTDSLQSKLNNLPANAEQNVQADWNETDQNSDAFIRNKPEISSGTGASSFDQLSGQIFPRQIADGGIMEIKLEQPARDKLNLIGHTRLANIDLIPSIDLKTSELTFTRHHEFQNVTTGDEGIHSIDSSSFNPQTTAVENLSYSRVGTSNFDLNNRILILKIDREENITNYRVCNTQTRQLGSPSSFIGGSHFVLLRTIGDFSYYIYGSAIDSFNVRNYPRGTQLKLQKDVTTSVSTVFHGELPDGSVSESKLSQDVQTKLNTSEESGTEVIANPGGGPQTQLNTISIDGDSYQIPQPAPAEGLEPNDRVILDHISFTHETTPPAFQRTHIAPEVIMTSQFKSLYREDFRASGVVNEISNSIFSVDSQPAANQRFYYNEDSPLDPFDTIGSQIYGGVVGLEMDFEDGTNNPVSTSRIYNFGFQYALISNNQGVNGLIGFDGREPLLAFDSQRGLVARIFNEISSGSHTVSETHTEFLPVANPILGTINGQTHDTATYELLDNSLNGEELTVTIVEQRNGIIQSQVPPHRTFTFDTSQSRNPVVSFATGTFVNSSKALNVRFDRSAGAHGTLIIHGTFTEQNDDGYLYEVRISRQVTTSITIDQNYFSQQFGNVGNGIDRNGLSDPSLFDTSQVGRQNNVFMTLRPTFAGTTATNPLMSLDMSINGHFFTTDTHRTLSDITGVTDLANNNPVLNIGSTISRTKHIYILSANRPIPQNVMNQASVSTREYLGFFDFISSTVDTIDFRADDIQLNGQSLLGRQPVLIATQAHASESTVNNIVLTQGASEFTGISVFGNNQLRIPRLAPEGYETIRLVMSRPDGNGGFTQVAEANFPYGLLSSSTSQRSFDLYSDGVIGSHRQYNFEPLFSGGNFFQIQQSGSGNSGTLTNYRTEFWLVPSGGQKGEKGDPGGATNFTELNDTPNNLGTAGQIIAVNSSGNSLEFRDIPQGGGGASDFTDLTGVIAADQIPDDLINSDKFDSNTRTQFNRFSSVDEVKLDSIESGATADQTGSEIISLIEAQTGDNRLDASTLRNLPTGGGQPSLDVSEFYAHLGIADLASSGTGLVSGAPSTLSVSNSSVASLNLRFDNQTVNSNIPTTATYNTINGQLVLPQGHWIICVSGNFTTSDYSSNSDRVYLELGLFYGNNQRHAQSLYLRNNSGGAIPPAGQHLTGSATIAGAVVSDGTTPVTVRLNAIAQSSETLNINGVHLHAYKQFAGFTLT